MISLKQYNEMESSRTELISTILQKLDTPIRPKDFAHLIRSVEVLENCDHYPGYKDLVVKIAAKASSMLSASLSGEDFVLIARATKLDGIPFGSEDRWKLLNQDEFNADFHGQVTLGERTLESFGDVTLETFYVR